MIMYFENKMNFITIKYYINNTDINLAAVHAKRVTIQIKNMQFIKKNRKKH